MKIASLPLKTALRLIIPFGFGFFLSMFTRTLSNIVKQPIQLELGLGEEAIGLALGTSFFLAFALAQLPVGVLVDRYDPRRVNASMFLLAAMGALVMSISDSGEMLFAGRALMGVGFAAGLMSSLKVYALWFPRERLATLNSMQFMIGVLGAWSATKPIELLLRVMDWRELYVLFAVATVIAALIIVCVSPRHEGEGSGETLGQQLLGLLSIYRDGYFWRVAPWMFVSMGVSQGLGTLYVFSWLTDVAQFSAPRAASGVAVVSLVSAVNFALLGPLSESLERRGFSPLLLPIVGQFLAMILLAVLAAQIMQGVVPQWALWTMLVGTATLVFATFAKAFPVHLIGRAYTAFNLLGFMTTALVQWYVGFMLDLYPRSEFGVASAQGYQAAFWGLLALVVAAAGWFVIATRLNIGCQTMLQKAANS